jgi:uncharacterized protein (TIGR00251 family)
MLISVRVVPRSAHNKLEWEPATTGGQRSLRARLTAPPVDGAANEALIRLLAAQLDIPKRAITIVRGATSRQKIIEIADLTPAILTQKIP